MDNQTIVILVSQAVSVLCAVAVNKNDIGWLKDSINELKQRMGDDKCCQK